MSYPQAAPPPQIPASELRPSRAWYWIAGVIAVIGVCVGAGLGALSITSLVRDVPRSMEAQFDSGSSATVELTGDKKWAVYVSSKGAGETGARVATDCNGSSANGGTIEVQRNNSNFQFDADGRHWWLAYDVDVSETGTYQIECQTTETGATDTRFGVAEAINVGSFVARIFGSIGALLGIPCLAITVAVVIAVVTAVRRNSHKKQLQQERMPGAYPPGQFGPGYPGPGQHPVTGYLPPPPGSPPPPAGAPPGPPQGPPPTAPQ